MTEHLELLTHCILSRIKAFFDILAIVCTTLVRLPWPMMGKRKIGVIACRLVQRSPYDDSVDASVGMTRRQV